MDSDNQISPVKKAVELYQSGKQAESYSALKRYLLDQHALLWLAKTSSDPTEAMAAAELALKLKPEDEVAQRALITLRQEASKVGQPEPPPETQLPAMIALHTELTLTQANAVIWPFNKINLPIGDALTQEKISFRDLAWAFKEARDTRVKDAARTILLSHLLEAQPEGPRPLLKVISGRGYTEFQERRSLVLASALISVSLLLLLVTILGAFFLLYLGIVQKQTVPIAISGTVLGLMLVIWGISEPLERLADQAENYRKGRLGEEKTVEALRASLDGRWSLVRNFEWPGSKRGDIDLILIGPGGIWAIEVKAYTGVIRNTGDRWERKTKKGWRKLASHPGEQARRNAARLQAYFNDRGVVIKWVEPVIIWAGEEETLVTEGPSVPVWKVSALADHIDSLWQKHRLPEETLQKACDLVTKAAEAARAKDQ